VTDDWISTPPSFIACWSYTCSITHSYDCIVHGTVKNAVKLKAGAIYCSSHWTLLQFKCPGLPTSCTACQYSAVVKWTSSQEVGCRWQPHVAGSACYLGGPNRQRTYVTVTPSPAAKLVIYIVPTPGVHQSYSLHTETTHHQRVMGHDCLPSTWSSVNNQLF